MEARPPLVGGAITADYWGAILIPRYFSYIGIHSILCVDGGFSLSDRTSTSYPQWLDTVVFLPVALRYGTRTLFSLQGTRYLF
jgi:hypothetical protein